MSTWISPIFISRTCFSLKYYV